MEYGAIDLHTKESEIRIIDEQGAVVFERRIATTRTRLTDVFGSRAPLRILLESGTGSEWVAQHLEALGHEVVVADPNYAPMYGHRQRRIKTDRRDVAALAEANRLGIYRKAHRVSAPQRDVRRRLRVRDQLVHVRRQAINLLRAQLRSEGVWVPTGAAETFVARFQASEVSATVRPCATSPGNCSEVARKTPSGNNSTRICTGTFMSPIVASVVGTYPLSRSKYRSRDMLAERRLFLMMNIGTAAYFGITTGRTTPGLVIIMWSPFDADTNKTCRLENKRQASA